jgi:hypothetical protein
MHDEASLGKRQQFINGLIGLGSIATMIVGVATRGRCGRGMGGYGGYGGGYGGYRGGYGGYGGGYGGYGGGYGGYGGGYYY